MGKSPDYNGQFMQTDYAYAALYFIPLIIAAVAGVAMVAGLTKLYAVLDAKKATTVKK
jgi:hypothetical protein